MPRARRQSLHARVPPPSTLLTAHPAAGRQLIVFETPDGVRRCLEAMAGDADAAVVRVKNRYAADYDAEETAGYRCNEGTCARCKRGRARGKEGRARRKEGTCARCKGGGVCHGGGRE